MLFGKHKGAGRPLATGKIINQALRGLAFSFFATSYAELYTFRTENRVAAISERMDNLAAAAQELSATIQEMAGSIQTATDEQNLVSSSVNAGSKALETALEKIAGAEGSISRLAEVVRDLARRVEHIEQAVTVITDITDQTHLLALNASIEAARAGDAGRGFAVVAGEIRNLAERTRHSADEIMQAVSQLKGGMHQTAAAMEESTGAVLEGLQLARGIAEPFNRIETSTNTVTRLMHDLSASSQQQAAVTQEVAASVSSVAANTNFAGELARESREQSDFAEQVLGQSWSYLFTQLAGSDTGLPGFLAQRVVDHARWIAGVIKALRGEEAAAGLADHRSCHFGRWYYGEGLRLGQEMGREVQEILAALEEPHRQVHQCGLQALESHRRQLGNETYEHINCLTKSSREIIRLMMELIDRIIALQEGQNKAPTRPAAGVH
ncbi:MAG: CZB domain-containing protein [Thermoanaerobacteraceae bacterium]|nr:CZB domain-containing protein [Thermoanaerobacteraceae bacterium]